MCALRVVVWTQLIVLKTFEDILFWDSSSSRAISLELVHGSRFTTAIMSSSLADDRAFRGRPTFTCAVDVSWRRCFKYLCLDKVDEDNVELMLLHVLKVKSMSQLSITSKALCIVVTSNTAEKFINAISLTATGISKTKCLRKYDVQYFLLVL
jgi:hypothetical protein